MFAFITLFAFTFHCQPGVIPPFTGMAVKETGVPEHTVVAVGTTVTLTGRFGLTVMVTGGLMAGLPVTQLSDEVNSQVTTSPFTALYA